MSLENVEADPFEQISSLLGHGYQTRIAKHFTLRRQTVSLWWAARRVPFDYVIDLSKFVDYKVTPHQLCPQRYPHPDDGLPASMRGAA